MDGYRLGGENDRHPSGFNTFACRTYDNLHVSAKTCQTIEQFGFANTPKLTAQHLG